MITFTGCSPDLWGFIPSFLNEDDETPTVEQLNRGQPGGWNEFKGFKFDPKSKTLKYPGDPIMHVMGTMHFRDDIIMLFPHSWIVVLHPDGKYNVARCD